MPSTHREWKAIVKEFLDKSNFPKLVGAADGKHVSIRAPANSGSGYNNYKNCLSIVLMAVVDANYKFLLVHIGANG